MHRRTNDDEWARLVEPALINRWPVETSNGGPWTVVQHADGRVEHRFNPQAPSELEYFSVDGGSVRTVEPDALYPIANDVPESNRHLDQYHTLDDVQLGLDLTGLGIALGSLTQIDEGEGVPTGLSAEIAIGLTS